MEEVVRNYTKTMSRKIFSTIACASQEIRNKILSLGRSENQQWKVEFLRLARVSIEVRANNESF